MRFGFERNRDFFGRAAVAVAGAAAASVAVIGVLALLASPAAAGPTPDYGIDFAVIGDPGNRNTNATEARPTFIRGQVNYKYRMARTEVTVGQWLEFVNAYRPYYEGPTHAGQFTGDWIVFDNSLGQYRAIAGSENFATNMGWRYAARFCNWLHNGKVMDQWAFENGAYDTSTFGQDANGNYTDQPVRHDDAKFWIPNLDEWTKAMHWDPNKNDGEGGYWRYPTSSDEAPIPGPPGTGDTNSGTGLFVDVGSYEHMMSPWGLLDGSGGGREWIESQTGTRRYIRGSSWAISTIADEIDFLMTGPPVIVSDGLRLAAIIPCPSPFIALVCAAVFHGCLRRR